jgi:hypothetical protein
MQNKANVHKAKDSIYQVKQKKPSKFNSTISPAKLTKQQIHDQGSNLIKSERSICEWLDAHSCYIR